MSERIAEVIEEVNLTRRERDSARHVILKAGELIPKWEARREVDYYELGVNVWQDASHDLAQVLTLELTRD